MPEGWPRPSPRRQQGSHLIHRRSGNELERLHALLRSGQQGDDALGTGPRHPYFADNTAAFIHELAADALSNATGDSNYVRVQILTPVGILDRHKQLGVVRELTDIVAAAAGDPTLAERTWVLISESPDGGWGIAGHANTGADVVAGARAALAAIAARRDAAE